MSAKLLYKDHADQLRHRRFIEATAAELARPVEEVELFYEEMLQAMIARASVREFLPILVAKNVKQILGNQSRS